MGPKLVECSSIITTVSLLNGAMRLLTLLIKSEKLPAGVFVRESIENAREEFIKSLHGATDTTETTAAAELFVKKIDVWILKFRSHAKSCPCINSQSRKALELMVRHGAANLIYREVLSKFGRDT